MLMKEGYHSCSIVLGELETIPNLMLLDMTDFDVILGMDWLESYHVTLDCHKKSVKFIMSGEPAFVFQGNKKEVSCNLISLMSARQMLGKGCQRYFEFARDVEKEMIELIHVLVVSEFSDVFPIEIPGLPPMKEIEFSIDVAPYTQPISIPPYRMASTELKEQLQDLLDKVFIWPSSSSWGASMLFVKKKDRSLRLFINYR